MDLTALGWSSALQEQFTEDHQRGFEPGRVALEDKHQFVVLTARGELSGHVTGKLLHHASSVTELPKVGDWVAVSVLPNEAKALIQRVLPRRTKLVRKAVGREIEEQVLAVNIDVAFIVQALDVSFNPRRLERFLVMAMEGGARPVVVLNKADLCDDAEARLREAQSCAGDALVALVSAKTGRGMKRLAELIRPSETVVFVGTSGVGKSSLINRLYGEEIQATIEVREGDAKGRHTTTWREMIQLPHGGLVIDTPGLREFQMWMADDGMQEAFSDLEELAAGCHFRDCSHTVEKKCRVLDGVTRGRISRERYENFVKLKRELNYLAEERAKHTFLARKRQAKIAQRAFNKFKRGQMEG